jgi:hypothetical protein
MLSTAVRVAEARLARAVDAVGAVGERPATTWRIARRRY